MRRRPGLFNSGLGNCTGGGAIGLIQLWTEAPLYRHPKAQLLAMRLENIPLLPFRDFLRQGSGWKANHSRDEPAAIGKQPLPLLAASRA